MTTELMLEPVVTRTSKGAAHQERPLHYTPWGYFGEVDVNAGEIDATTPASYSAMDSAMAVAPSSASLVLTSVETTIEYAWAS
jgi:hypothetical protein